MTNVVLTNEQGADLGTAEIVEAHTGEGKLHKAFSIFIFRKGGEKLLLQRRSKEKMLFPLHWANTCCSHPRQNESIVEAAERRLEEECGFTTDLTPIGEFVYRAVDQGRGVEHELDTVLVGEIEDAVLPKPNEDEIHEIRWMTLDELYEDMKAHMALYAPWFPIALKMVLDSRK